MPASIARDKAASRAMYPVHSLLRKKTVKRVGSSDLEREGGGREIAGEMVCG